MNIFKILLTTQLKREQKSAKRNQTGFTLIELSVVLVIIGLVVGGIVVGQTMIHQADVRKEVKQLQDYVIAFNNFQTKFNCVPGDCPNATTFFGPMDTKGNTINNGNGNGMIDTSNGASTNVTASFWSSNTEIWGAIQQLSLANMISFTPGVNITTPALGTTVPTVSLNPSAGLFMGASYNFAGAGGAPTMSNYQSGNNTLWLTLCSNAAISANYTMNLWDDNCAVFTAADLQAIDQKIDDGSPLTGKLIGFGGFGTNSNCLNGTGTVSTYNTSITTPQCQAGFVIN